MLHVIYKVIYMLKSNIWSNIFTRRTCHFKEQVNAVNAGLKVNIHETCLTSREP